MTDSTVAMVLARLPREEGDRIHPYDDATAAEVRAPKGNLSWGRGFNLAAIGSTALFDLMSSYLVQQRQNDLLKYAWYQQINKNEPVRASAFLDIAYNEGLEGLLHFPKMIHAATVGDWETASKECDISKTNPQVDKQRYAALRFILLYGKTP